MLSVVFWGKNKILLNSSAKPKKAGVLSEAFATLRAADVPAQGGHCLIHSRVPLQISYMKNEVLKADF